MHIVDITPKNNPSADDKDDNERFDYYNKYYELHKEFLQPTNIKIDVDLFNNEITQYNHLFRQWGYNRPHNPRYGISLFNFDGNIRSEVDYGCCPLDTAPPELQLKEKDFKVKTEVYTNMKSMRVFDPIEKHLIRSNILLFHKGANFTPHVDVCPLPGYNLRLWGNTDPDNYIFNYYGNVAKDVEPGRLYLTDTSLWHTALSLANWNYTFFIALRGDCIDEVNEWLI